MRYARAFALTVLLATTLAAQPLKAIAEEAQKRADADQFSGVLLVARDGKPVLERTFGFANREAKLPNTMQTKFNIGSINKAFTRRAIEQLAAAGKLSLNDTIRKHLPGYPSPVADRITIDQLLEQRSGLGDFFGPKYRAAPPSHLRELSDFLPLFVNDPLQFEPGTSQRYSNAGYIVLGLIIERVSGEKYRDYVQKHIFAPAGMTNSGFWAVDEKVANRATGYTRRGPDGPLPERISNASTLPGRPSSAGGAYSTASDLLKFTQWLKADGLGIAGGAPGLNASIEVSAPWTVIALANYDPPAAENLVEAVMPMISKRRGQPGPKVVLQGPVAVPLAAREHLMSVEVMVNDQGPFHFTIDTGAAGPLRISAELARQLSLPVVGEAIGGDPSGRNARPMQIVRVNAIAFGGARFADLNAAVTSGGGAIAADGVIGLGLFSGLTATIDYPKREFRLTRKAIAAGDHAIPFTLERGIPQIEVDAAGTRITADVDTGSPAMLSIPTSIKLPFTSEPRVVGHGRTTSNEFEILGAELNGDLHVAGWTQSKPAVDIVELLPVANVGARFLRQYAVSFDMVNRRMSLDK